MYLELALDYLLSSWWATEHSSGYLRVFWVSEVGSAACGGTMATLPVVPGIAHLNIACIWSPWALVCADVQQDIIMDFPSPKLNIMLGLPFFHFHSPFCSYIWGLLTSICLFSKHTCRAGKQPCLCPVEWDPRTHSKAARITWDFTAPPVWGQPSVPQQSWWLCGSSFSSTTLAICTSQLEGGPSCSDLHTKWTGSKSILCSAAWARRWPLWGKHCHEMPDIWGLTLGVCSGAEYWCQCTSFSITRHPLSLMKISLPSKILVNVVIMKVQIF